MLYDCATPLTSPIAHRFPSLRCQIYTLLEDHQAAINVYMDCLEHSPENTEVLTTLGLLFLR